MSNKINEGIINFILKKAIGLIAGGDYRRAVKAFKGDKGLQRDLVKMAKNRQDFEKKLKAKLKSDPEFKKVYQKNMSMFK
tara:strand:+ start:791 stop:1030 length:240 start_codon:yes stop_codon:yes gene_type:complete